ncbi:MAG TPA: response regulator [Anaerolineaceae bacterium]|nr:response regulator [Anaerolineaceae bacterium]
MNDNQLLNQSESHLGNDQIAQISLKGLSVLVVEDNVSNFVLLARMLGYLGIHCEWKTSGYEVVEFADNLPKLDLILMDLRLPYEDGYSALRKIQKSDRLKNIPVIAITAEADPEQIEKAKAAGFNGFLGKPINLDKFPSQIRQVLSGNSIWEL